MVVVVVGGVDRAGVIVGIGVVPGIEVAIAPGVDMRKRGGLRIVLGAAGVVEIAGKGEGVEWGTLKRADVNNDDLD